MADSGIPPTRAASSSTYSIREAITHRGSISASVVVPLREGSDEDSEFDEPEDTSVDPSFLYVNPVQLELSRNSRMSANLADLYGNSEHECISEPVLTQSARQAPCMPSKSIESAANVAAVDKPTSDLPLNNTATNKTTSVTPPVLSSISVASIAEIKEISESFDPSKKETDKKSAFANFIHKLPDNVDVKQASKMIDDMKNHTASVLNAGFGDESFLAYLIKHPNSTSKLFDVIKSFLDAGADVNVISYANKEHVFITAVRACCEKGLFKPEELFELFIKPMQAKEDKAKETSLRSVDKCDANGQSAFMWAAKLGCLKYMKWLLDHGADVHQVDKYGFNAWFHVALLLGNDSRQNVDQASNVQAIFDLLREKKCNASQRGLQGETLLMMAPWNLLLVEECKKSMQKENVNAVCDVTTKCGENLPHGLLVHCKQGWSAAVILLERKTPLPEATLPDLIEMNKQEFEKCFQLQVDMGLDIDATVGELPLVFRCVSHCYIAIFDQLVKADVNLDATYASHTILAEVVMLKQRPCTHLVETILEKRPKLVNKADGAGDTPLHVALANNELYEQEVIVACFIKAGADLLTTDQLGNTALLLALKNKNTNVETVDLLVNGGSDLAARNKAGDSLLWLACDSSCPNKVSLFAEHALQADYKKTDQLGNTALLLALKNKNTNDDTVKLLVDGGSDVTSRNNEGASCLSEAVRSKSAVVIKLLVDSGADLSTEKDSLALALKNKRPADVVTLLLNESASTFNERDKDGGTALFYACKEGGVDPDSIHFLRLLLQKADIHVVNNEGKNCLFAAIEQRAYLIVDILLEHCQQLRVEEDDERLGEFLSPMDKEGKTCFHMLCDEEGRDKEKDYLLLYKLVKDFGAEYPSSTCIRFEEDCFNCKRPLDVLTRQKEDQQASDEFIGVKKDEKTQLQEKQAADAHFAKQLDLYRSRLRVLQPFATACSECLRHVVCRCGFADSTNNWRTVHFNRCPVPDCRAFLHFGNFEEDAQTHRNKYKDAVKNMLPEKSKTSRHYKRIVKEKKDPPPPTLVMTSPSKSWRSPLMNAVTKPNFSRNPMEAMTKKEFETWAEKQQRYLVLLIASATVEQVNEVTADKRSALTFAVDKLKYDCVLLLLVAGADASVLDEYRKGLIVRASENEKIHDPENKRFMKMLIESWAYYVGRKEWQQKQKDKNDAQEPGAHVEGMVSLDLRERQENNYRKECTSRDVLRDLFNLIKIYNKSDSVTKSKNPRVVLLLDISSLTAPDIFGRELCEDVISYNKKEGLDVGQNNAMGFFQRFVTLMSAVFCVPFAMVFFYPMVVLLSSFCCRWLCFDSDEWKERKKKEADKAKTPIIEGEPLSLLFMRDFEWTTAGLKSMISMNCNFFDEKEWPYVCCFYCIPCWLVCRCVNHDASEECCDIMAGLFECFYEKVLCWRCNSYDEDVVCWCDCNSGGCVGVRPRKWCFLPLLSLAFGAFFLWLPVLIVLLFMSPTSDYSAAWISIGTFLLLLFATTLMLLYRAYQDTDLQTVDSAKTKKKVRRWNLGNCLAVVSLILDFIQLSSFAIVPKSYPEDAHLDYIAEIGFFGLNSTHLAYSQFMVAAGIACAWLAVATLLTYIEVKGETAIHLFAALPLGTFLVTLLSDTVFLFVVKGLLTWVNCNYDGEVAVLEVDSSVVCWTGLHRWYALASLFLVGCYIITCNSIGALFLEDTSGDVDIVHPEVFLLTDRLFKLTLAVGNIFFKNIPQVDPAMSVVAATCMLIHLRGELMTEEEPKASDRKNSGCVVGWFRNSEKWMYRFVIWCATISLVASLDESFQHSWVPLIVMVSGIGLMLLYKTKAMWQTFRKEIWGVWKTQNDDEFGFEVFAIDQRRGSQSVIQRVRRSRASVKNVIGEYSDSDDEELEQTKDENTTGSMLRNRRRKKSSRLLGGGRGRGVGLSDAVNDDVVLDVRDDPNVFRYVNRDFDHNGFLYALGICNPNPTKRFVNPALSGHVKVISNKKPIKDSAPRCAFVGRDLVRCVFPAEPNVWVGIDLKDTFFLPTHYTLRHYVSSDNFALRNWVFEARANKIEKKEKGQEKVREIGPKEEKNEWVLLRRHIDDISLDQAGQSHTWPIDPATRPKSQDFRGWRMFRIRSTGLNSGLTLNICLSGFEMYGTSSQMQLEPPAQFMQLYPSDMRDVV